jgi:hypothetical protein
LKGAWSLEVELSVEIASSAEACKSSLPCIFTRLRALRDRLAAFAFSRLSKKSATSKEIPDAGFKHARAPARISI